MIPSLVVDDIRSALVEYLASTFALADDDARDALTAFLTDQSDGIFRGPYLRVRTPFRQVEPNWRQPLDWLPDNFLPYIHQAKSFERLGSRDSNPEPTIVTTGTGSGKTESFLFPILDHCARARQRGEEGVKALILYPMNALASDQAGRIAEIIEENGALAGVTAGVYLGEDGSHGQMGPNNIIDQRQVMRTRPPDILLTNYKMLDFLLLRRDDRDLWAVNEPDTLQYVVLDEFHTYDGAQGTDVAMLLRRLGQTLKMSTGDRPLGTATAVATSATLASGASATSELREFAERVFGMPFPESSIIGEERQSVDEACGAVNHFLSVPSVDQVLLTPVDSPEDLITAFCTEIDAEGKVTPPAPDIDPYQLGELLLAHPLTRAILGTVADRPRTWANAVAELVNRLHDWGRTFMVSPQRVEQALTRYLWLLSIAKRRVGEREMPLFNIEVQMWVREVSRLLRQVADEPHFRWLDSAAAEPDDELPGAITYELPAVYCRFCGMSGWQALASVSGLEFNTTPSSIYAESLDKSSRIRTLMKSSPEDPLTRWFNPSERMLGNDPENSVPVLATSDPEDAKAQRCPACSERNAIRYLGLRVASLTSVSINTLFASTYLEQHERKLLAFTDSVQDASHRAAFFAGRTHRVNLRTLMSEIIQRNESLSLAELGDELAQSAETAHQRFERVPPDLLGHPKVKTTWTDSPDTEGVEVLNLRLGFEADLEFGLRSRVGRTLELSGVASAAVVVDDMATELVAEALAEQLDNVPDQAVENLSVYVRGMAERLRLRGGIVSRLLDPYINSGGSQWFVWGGRPDGLPPFTPDQGRPSFATTAAKGDFDSVTALSPTHTWFVDWAVRTLGLTAEQSRTLNSRVYPLLASATDMIDSRDTGGARSFGLNRHVIRITDAASDGQAIGVRCNTCGNRHATSEEAHDWWTGTNCLRYRCPGLYITDPAREANYYRKLYRSGVTRRVVTGEHTGLLKRKAREELEEAFKRGTAPSDPNVLTATPTLEMGIDIGDLSAVMLTSVPRTPASYAQRVGRAGRKSGNALIATFVRTDRHGLYYLAEPEAMIAGAVKPPNCYLDAFDLLRRQYHAYLFDRMADYTIDSPPLPREVGALMNQGMGDGSILRGMLDASMGDNTHIDSFIDLFGTNLTPDTAERLREYAGGDIEPNVKHLVELWNDELREFRQRADRLNRAAEKAEEEAANSGDDSDLKNLRGQRSAVLRALGDKRSEYSLSALGRMSLLPNYTLVDDTARLVATMWSPPANDGDSYETTTFEYDRAAVMAVREFAPGNSFYAGGYRHVVDALDVGPIDEPLHHEWRLCPDCGYGTDDISNLPPVCPRCESAQFNDIGNRYELLAMRTALASGSEEAARVFDESDERRRERFDVITTVDVDPAQVEGPWKLVDRAFGAELARNSRLRTVNLGSTLTSGDKRSLAGKEFHISGFTACAACGAVLEARDDKDGTKPERNHQGWCKVRSGALKQKWNNLLLFHELTTDAVRFLLPVSLFQVDERLASFKGALMLGLRSDFGGDPDHLQVTTADMPNRRGQGQRNFLVLYDRVPGGTGYLGRLANPDRVRAILEAGRQIIATCPCQNEARQACHRCLLGVVDQHEYDLVRRDLALSLLDELLNDWRTEDVVGNISRIDIGRIEESELERRFKVALQDWAALPDSDHVSLQPLPGKNGYDAFELRITDNDETIRYRIDEQEGLSSVTSTLPDFFIKRMDQSAPDVAVFLDGLQFHASPENNQSAGDAAKRAELRRKGVVVWNLTWDDVDKFHKAVRPESNTRKVERRPLLVGAPRQTAMRAHNDSPANLAYDSVDFNPVELLLEYLAHPEADEWERLALSAVTGAAAGNVSPIASNEVSATVLSLRSGLVPELEGATSPVAVGGVFSTNHDLPLGLLLDTKDTSDENWTAFVVLPDADDDVASSTHRDRWHDWLQWSNLVQFLKSNRRNAIISCTSQADEALLEELWISIRATHDEETNDEPEDLQPVELSDEDNEELDLIEGDEVRALVKSAMLLGAPRPAVGVEHDSGVPMEASWDTHKVAVGVPGSDFDGVTGWDARPVESWTVDELLAALKGGN